MESIRPIVFGVFSSENEAEEILSALQEKGYERDCISLFMRPAGLEKLVGCGIPKKRAHIYAEHIQDGGVLIAILCMSNTELWEAQDILKKKGAEYIDVIETGLRKK